VQSVTGTGFVLEGVLRTRGAGSTGAGTASPAPTASPSAQAITVVLGSSATVTTTQSTTSAAAKVGLCATAIGTVGSTGAVAARSIALSQPTGTGCSLRFGGFGGQGAGQGGGLSG
jgi:hypothetical protein